MRNARLDESQAGIKIAWRNINNLRYAGDTTRMAQSKELKNLLMKVKEEGEKKLVLKLSIQKTRSWHPSPSHDGKYMGKKWKRLHTLFSWALKSLWMLTTVMKLKDTCPWKKN